MRGLLLYRGFIETGIALANMVEISNFEESMGRHLHEVPYAGLNAVGLAFLSPQHETLTRTV
jgi:hypothetical protein